MDKNLVDFRLLVSGCMVLSKTWKTLGQNYFFSIPHGITLQQVSSEKVHGLDSLRGFTSFARIPVSSYSTKALGEYEFSQFFGFKKSYTEVNQRQIVLAFRGAVDYAVSKMEPSLTYGHWTCINHLRTINYLEGGNLHHVSLINDKCPVCNESEHEIKPQHVVEFGMYFLEHFKQSASKLDFSTWLLATNRGLNLPFEAAEHVLSRLDVRHAQEIVAHVVRDFFQRGKCLLWSRQKVFELFGVPTTEAYPYFVKGYGRFTYDYCLSILSSSTHPPALISLSLPDLGGEVSTQMIKFCVGGGEYCGLSLTNQQTASCLSNTATWSTTTTTTTAIKNCYKFEEESVLDMFNGQSRNGLVILDLLEWLDIMEKNVKGEYEKAYWASPTFSYKGARFEAALSMKQFDGGIEGCLKKFRDYFERNYSQENLQHLLGIFPLHSFVRHMQRTVIPAVNTLRQIAHDTRRAPNPGLVNSSLIPNIYKLNRAQVCQLVILYGVYGDFKKVGGRMVEFFAQRLHLEMDKFRQCEQQPVAPFASGFEEMSPFLFVSTSNNLYYKGPLGILPNVYERLNTEVDNPAASVTINKALCDIQDIRWSKTNEFRQNGQIDQILWTAIINHTKGLLFPDIVNKYAITFGQVFDKVSNVHIEPITTLEFVNWLAYKKEKLEQRSVGNIFGSLQYGMTRDDFKNYKRRFAEMIERELYKNEIGFLYQKNTATWWCILAMFSVPNYCFGVLEGKKREKMVKVYKTVLNKVAEQRSLEIQVPDPAPKLEHISTHEHFGTLVMREAFPDIIIESLVAGGDDDDDDDHDDE